MVAVSPALLAGLAALCGLALAAVDSERLPALLAAAGVAVGALLSPVLGGALVLGAAGLRTGSWAAPLLVGAVGGWGAALVGTGAAAGGGLCVLALVLACRLPAPGVAIIARVGGAGGLLLAAEALAPSRAAWWPLLLAAGFALVAVGALQSLSPGRRWAAAAATANLGLVVLLAGLGASAAAATALAALALGEVLAALAEHASSRRAARLAAMTLGGLPPLGLAAWIAGLSALHASGFSVAPVLAWAALALGAVQQLRATEAPALVRAPEPPAPLRVALAVVSAAVWIVALSWVARVTLSV